MDLARLPQVPDGPRFGYGVRQEQSMERRTFMALVSGSLLATPLAAGAQQQAGRVYRIGFISASSLKVDPIWEAFVEKLRELGYVPGQNVVIERRVGKGRIETSSAAAAELLLRKVDVIWVGGTPGAQAVKRAPQRFPSSSLLSVTRLVRGS